MTAIFYEIYSNLPRQGPGNAASTQRALQQIPNLALQPKILDIGCGSGSQTLNLSYLLDGCIIAVDNHPPFVGQLGRAIKVAGLEKRVEVLNIDMMTLELLSATFDLIWAEGSIYIIGFERGWQTWKHWIKPGGYLAVTELTWLQPHPPIAVQQFWQAAYPAMQDVASNLQAIVVASSYDLINTFPLPEAACGMTTTR